MLHYQPSSSFHYKDSSYTPMNKRKSAYFSRKRESRHYMVWDRGEEEIILMYVIPDFKIHVVSC